MKKKMSLLAVLLMAVAVTAYSVSGTYAKYTSSTDSKSDTARVAKWDIDFNTLDTVDHAFTFDLFDTIVDTDDSGETDVWSNAADKVIAPGTKGEFIISLLNNSEVTANYSIDFDVTNGAGIPVEFSVNDGDWTATLADIADTELSKDSTNPTAVKVQWRWTFEGNDDSDDTALGLDGTATIEVAAQVTATQVD